MASRVDAAISTDPPSATVTVSFTVTGASLTSATVSVNVTDADFGGSPSSVAVMRMVCEAGVSSSSGVPLNVRVVALKLSQSGSEPPPSSTAV